MKNLRKGFTLVELLVVIAVIGILFVVLISKVDFATDKAKETGVKTDFRSYELAMEQVAREQTGFAISATPLATEEAFIVTELNKNLDKKLRITDAAAGTAGDITITAKDPWGTAYKVALADDATNGDRVTVTSAGPDKNFGDPAGDAAAKAAVTDNISIFTYYGANGVESHTSGLSNNL